MSKDKLKYHTFLIDGNTHITLHIYYIKELNSIYDNQSIINIKDDISYDLLKRYISKKYAVIYIKGIYGEEIRYTDVTFSIDENFVIGEEDGWNHNLIMTYKTMDYISHRIYNIK